MKWFGFFTPKRKPEPKPKPRRIFYDAFPHEVRVQADYLQVNDQVVKSRFSAQPYCIFPIDVGAVALKDGHIVYHNPNYKDAD